MANSEKCLDFEEYLTQGGQDGPQAHLYEPSYRWTQSIRWSLAFVRTANARGQPIPAIVVRLQMARNHLKWHHFFATSRRSPPRTRSFPGSAWERTVLEALPPADDDQTTIRQAEPAIHWVPRQSLGTRWWCSARSDTFSVGIG